MTRLLLAFCLLFPFVAKAAIEVEIHPVGPDETAMEKWTEEILADARMQSELDSTRFRVLMNEVLAADDLSKSNFTSIPHESQAESTPPRLRLTIYDYTHDRILTVIRDQDGLVITPQVVFGKDDQPLPTHEDFLLGVEILERDPVLGPMVRQGDLVPYESMPLLLSPQNGSGKRIIPIGLRAASKTTRHEIVGVDLSRGMVERFSRGAPETARATFHTCGPESANQPITRIGTPGTVEIRVRQGNEEIWRMTATRPAASSGRWGSGVELKDIRYKGRLVLRRAHAPILNVDYINDRCGPYRDPVNNENAFRATGTRITSGFIRSPEVPKTIFETGVDRGNYRGVAVYEDSQQLVLTSELSATWYRYASEFRFHVDGTIEPIFKFDAVHNSCTCLAHHHHVYWRFDFDVDMATDNTMEVASPSGWETVTREARHVRAAGQNAWRIKNAVTGRGYSITPGSYDSSTNVFGRGDAWVLRYKRGEVDDSRLGSSKHAKIDSWVNGEGTVAKDLVFWYAGHILHDEDEVETPHVAGPTFKPFGP